MAEGQVWQTSARAVGRPPPGSVWVQVSDRGSVIFEYLAECLAQDQDFIVTFRLSSDSRKDGGILLSGLFGL
jgi:hypothetical protein